MIRRAVHYLNTFDVLDGLVRGGWTQSRLALRPGLDRSFVSQLVNAHRPFSSSVPSRLGARPILRDIAADQLWIGTLAESPTSTSPSCSPPVPPQQEPEPS